MKKSFSVLVGIALAIGLGFFLRSQSLPHAETKPTGPPGSSSRQTSTAFRTLQESNGLAEAPALFLQGPLMSSLRTALAANDRPGFERSFGELTEYIKSHPEQIEEYLAGLRGEKEEHVLRALARAMAASGVMWNDQVAQTAIELSRDSSFPQRQHISLHLMSGFPELREDLHAAVLERTRNDPDSQVKTSAATVLADWIEQMPDNATLLLGDLSQIFHTATEKDLLAFTYQLLALHKEKLSPEMHASVFERYKAEKDSYAANLLTTSLLTAPEEIRQGAILHVRNSFESAKDLEDQRNFLAQIVCLEGIGALPLLKEKAKGTSLLAEDAGLYIPLLAGGEPLEPETIFMQKAIRDAQRAKTAGSHHEDHDKEEK